MYVYSDTNLIVIGIHLCIIMWFHINVLLLLVQALVICNNDNSSRMTYSDGY